MPTFKRKPTFCDAEQFTDHDNPPRGVHKVTFGGPSTETDPLFYVITMQEQQVNVSKGEWIVAESDGAHFYPIADEEFQRIYEPA